MHKLIISDKR